MNKPVPQPPNGVNGVGGDVSRGRVHLKPGVRLALAGTVAVLVVGGIGWTLMPAPHKGPPAQSFNHNEGQPYREPAIPASYRLPSPVPPSPPAVGHAAAATLPAPTVVPTAMPMGFYQDTSYSQGATQQTSRQASANSGGPGISVGQSPQDAGVDPAQHHAGVAKATVGKPFNRHFLLKRNTIFHCVPEQRLDSAVPGAIGCTVADDVMSADGEVVLIEKGSSVDGEVISGPSMGENRMFIGFDEVLTLSGIPIYLSGGGGDTLGTSGVDGAIDEHMWRKIKGAVLLSAVQIAGQIASNETQKANNLNLNVGSQGSSLAETALAHDINIADSLMRNQADPITVTVRQDIPMDDAYRLVVAGGSQ